MQTSCESKGLKGFWGFGGLINCAMNESTIIDANDTTVLAEPSVQVLDFGYNKKIEFLPVEVANSFPALKIYAANDCSIKTIAKVNFKDMQFLMELTLENNQIEIIRSDTFEDLISLQGIYLRELPFLGKILSGSNSSNFFHPENNKIKSMNGRLFGGLNKLKTVHLIRNKCIDEGFFDKYKLVTLSEVVTVKCGFIETNEDDLKFEKD